MGHTHAEQIDGFQRQGAPRCHVLQDRVLLSDSGSRTHFATSLPRRPYCALATPAQLARQYSQVLVGVSAAVDPFLPVLQYLLGHHPGSYLREVEVR